MELLRDKPWLGANRIDKKCASEAWRTRVVSTMMAMYLTRSLMVFPWEWHHAEMSIEIFSLRASPNWIQSYKFRSSYILRSQNKTVNFVSLEESEAFIAKETSNRIGKYSIWKARKMSSQAWTPIHQSQVTTTNAKKLFWNRPSSSLLRRLLQYWPYWILLFFLLLLLKSLGATQLLYFANSSNTSSWLYVATFRLSILRLFTAPKTSRIIVSWWK